MRASSRDNMADWRGVLPGRNTMQATQIILSLVATLQKKKGEL